MVKVYSGYQYSLLGEKMTMPELTESEMKTLMVLRREPISVDNIVRTEDGVRALEYLLYLGLVDIVDNEEYSDIVILTEKGRRLVEILKSLIESGELDLKALGLDQEGVLEEAYPVELYQNLSTEDLRILLLLYFNGGKLKWYQLIRAARKRPSSRLLKNGLIRRKKIKPERGRSYTVVEITKEGIALLDTMFSRVKIDPTRWIEKRRGFKTPSSELIYNLSKILSSAE
ncbi:MAG: hypothetical protein DRJ49_04430 [Thermoprotei archaeon]|nr:MAG: hypothetical protein DRJ49_04430 [Thermoprotei archaeon]